MNIIRNSVSALVLATVGLVGPALAHDDGPKGHAQHSGGTHGPSWRSGAIHQRATRASSHGRRSKRQRIDNGWRSGELTPGELRRLDAQQTRIAEMAPGSVLMVT